MADLNKALAALLNEGEDTYIVDSIPVPVCQIAREKQSKGSAAKTLKQHLIKVIELNRLKYALAA